MVYPHFVYSSTTQTPADATGDEESWTNEMFRIEEEQRERNEKRSKRTPFRVFFVLIIW